MTDEGEGGSTTTSSWRRRWLAGLLFALVGLGIVWAHREAWSTHVFATAAAIGRVVGGVGLPAALAALAALAAVCLGVVTAVGRGGGSPQPEAAVPRRAAGSPTVHSALPPSPWASDGRRLLALFARPCVQPLRAIDRDEHAGGPAPTAVDVRAIHGPSPPKMIRLFGALAVDGADGGRIGTSGTRGLIAFLVLHPGGVCTDELLNALWPQERSQISRPRLWEATRNARALLGGGIVRRGTRVELDHLAVTVDAWEIERITRPGAALNALERAHALARAAPLQDVDYPWADGERRRLQAVRLDLLVRLGSARLEAGDSSGALSVAEELVAADPLNERGWRLAMEAEAIIGARSSIVERYESLRRELDRTLGLRPQEETRATYLRLLGQS